MLTDSHPHDLVITLGDGGLQVVSDLNPNAMPLHFTVLFPWGDQGWDSEARSKKTNKRLTAREFFIYRLAIRDKPLTYVEASQKDVVDNIHGVDGCSKNGSAWHGLLQKTRGLITRS